MDRINTGRPMAPVPLVRKSPSWQQQREEKERKKKEKKDSVEINGGKDSADESTDHSGDSVNPESEIEERGKKIDIQV